MRNLYIGTVAKGSTLSIIIKRPFSLAHWKPRASCEKNRLDSSRCRAVPEQCWSRRQCGCSKLLTWALKKITRGSVTYLAAHAGIVEKASVVCCLLTFLNYNWTLNFAVIWSVTKVLVSERFEPMMTLDKKLRDSLGNKMFVPHHMIFSSCWATSIRTKVVDRQTDWLLQLFCIL